MSGWVSRVVIKADWIGGIDGWVGGWVGGWEEEDVL